MRILSLALIVLFLSSCASKRLVKVPLITTSMRQDVGTLSADMMQGRAVGTEGEKMAAAYISKRMRDIGLAPRGNGSSYLQSFRRVTPLNPHAEPSADDPAVEGLNVVGSINNGAKYMVVIGAHYDHLGMGGSNSLWDGEPTIHNGADDNASGVAIMLSLAASLKESGDKRFNYLFIAFSGEEMGLWGSNYFVKHPTILFSQVSYMLNLDMVGRLNAERQLAVYGTGTSPVWDDVLAEIEEPGFKLTKEQSGIGPSDHTSFYLADVPVLHFFTGQHKEYHKPTDDLDKINFAGMNDIAAYLVEIVKRTDAKKKLSFTKTKDDQEMTPDFKVTLGVMPDYLFDGKGMRIDGIREGRPAFNADIQKGDVVVKMGDYEVVDMQTYMECLSKFEKGETVPVTIKRGGQEINKSVTF